MVTRKDSSTPDLPEYLSNTPSKTAIARFVCQIDTSTAGAPCTIYVLHPDFTRAELLEVLAEVRALHPGVTVNACGREIAAFSYPDVSR